MDNLGERIFVPRVDTLGMALLVGVYAQNSFILPTHQVNALLMGPGGYTTEDYLKTGTS